MIGKKKDKGQVAKEAKLENIDESVVESTDANEVETDSTSSDASENGTLSNETPDKKSLKHKKRQSKRAKAKEKASVVRVEELKKFVEQNRDLDDDAIVSAYIPRRRAKKLGASILRLNKLNLTIMGLLVLVLLLFAFAFMQEKMGNFTINLNRLDLFRKGIAISADGDFSDPTARLTANAVEDAMNISIEDLPEDLDNIEGDHNGRNYMAYTYYVRNAGKEDVGYNAVITLDSYAKGAEEAVRVAVWKNGERIVYAEPASDGNPEEGCTNFEEHDKVCTYSEENFLVGNVDKYTIVIWMEGDDPECVDKIVGGSVEFTMRIDSISDDNENLLIRYINDIKDMLTNNKSIGAAGNDAPDYYNEGEITWDNRRNQ